MSKIKIILNGEEKILEKSISIAQLVKNLELDTKKIAIEKDLEIVAPEEFEKIFLENNSRVEIVHFIGGG